MDLLERALALAASPLFAELAPAVLIRLAERARAAELAAGERRTTDDTVWIVADGSLVVASHKTGSIATASDVRRRGGTATRGNALGLVRVVSPATPMLEAVAERPSVVVGLAIDDVRDVLDEDPAALAALADALSRALADGVVT